MAYPPVVIVDANDKEVGAAPLPEAWEQGLYHRIVRVLVENSRGQVLLQHRSESVKLYPGCWDVSASGHVDEGMTYEGAARQEMAEELGLHGGELKEILYYQSRETYKGRTLNRFNKLYLLRSDRTPTELSADEVSEVRWFTKAELYDLVTNHPDRISDGLRQTVERLYAAQPPAPALAVQ
jgi:isopentenyl-diphosphate delta-isomerase